MSPPRAGTSRKKTDGNRVLAANKMAFRNYEIEERFEAGIELSGTEVKSLRSGKADLKDAFARVRDEQVFLYNFHIPAYAHGNIQNHEPERPRRLLLHLAQIRTLIGKTTMRGYTIVPLKCYLKGSWIKVELALARGKKVHDRRESIKKRMQEREMRAELKRR